MPLVIRCYKILSAFLLLVKRELTNDFKVLLPFSNTLSFTDNFNYFRCSSKLLALCVTKQCIYNGSIKEVVTNSMKMHEMMPFEDPKMEGKRLCLKIT